MSKLNKILLYGLCITIFVLINGCGPKYNFNKAKKLEQKEYYVQAIKKYIYVSEKFPESEYAPEAVYNAGRIYQKNLKIYNEAVKLYSELIYKYPSQQQWVKLAKIGIFESPDYFPLKDGYVWVEGDSDTLGKNMRVEYYCTQISSFTYSIKKRYYAGNKIVTELKRYYTKEDYELREMINMDSVSYTVLLSYPFEKMKSWITTRDNRKLKLTIVSDSVSVITKAGKFDNCIKIREESIDYPGAYKYEYYAPDIGHVLTTIGTAKSEVEHRNIELISYKF